jgi:ABC-type sugar transport system substrate-binding protein
MASRKVIVSLVTEHQEYQQLLAAEARAAGALHGLEVEVLWAGNDPLAQVRQVTAAVSVPAADRPAAIVMQPAAAVGLDGVGRSVHQAGVGWVTLGDRAPAVEALRAEFPGLVVATVGTDNDGVGRLQARCFRALLPRGGRVVYVEGPSVNPAVIHRRKSMMDGLLGSSIELVKTLAGDWTAASAERAAQFWLRLGGKAERPDLVGAQNDEMALGVRKAFLELRPEWKGVRFTGVDGTPEGGQRLVEERVLAATVITPPPTGAAMDLVAHALHGEATPPFTLLPPHLQPPM